MSSNTDLDIQAYHSIISAAAYDVAELEES